MTQTIERSYENPVSAKTARVMITNDKLLDDSVMGVKYKLVLRRIKTGAWIIETINPRKDLLF